MTRPACWLFLFSFVINSSLYAQEAKKPVAKKKKAAVTAPAVQAPEASEGPKVDTVGSSGPTLNFSTEGGTPDNTDHRDTIQFKGLSAPTQEATQPQVEIKATEDEGFKTYIGYPKHQLALIDSYGTLSATWNYNGQDFNFNTSTLAYGLAYRFIATPSIQLEAAYSRYNVGIGAGKASGFSINDSDVDVDQYGVSGQYCMISPNNFYKQFCLGGMIGNDAYPVLQFVGASQLKMGKVQDIAVGIKAGLQLPFTDSVFFRGQLAYNYGTGAGNSGELTPPNNSSFAVDLAVPWQINAHHGLNPHVDYVTRQATIEGKIGSNKDKWATDSTTLGGGVDYVYTF
jgi:hypothetical protein